MGVMGVGGCQHGQNPQDVFAGGVGGDDGGGVGAGAAAAADGGDDVHLKTVGERWVPAVGEAELVVVHLPGYFWHFHPVGVC